MKRSNAVTLGLMATTAVAFVAFEQFGGQENQAEARSYPNLDACIADGALDEATCRETEQAARAEHEASAPRYSSQSLCEEQFGYGQCQARSGGSFWQPFFTGFLVANLLDNVGGLRYRAQPYYRTRDGLAMTPGGYRINRGPGGVAKVSKNSLTRVAAPPKVQTRTSVVARGGFGSRARGFSFGG